MRLGLSFLWRGAAAAVCAVCFCATGLAEDAATIPTDNAKNDRVAGSTEEASKGGEAPDTGGSSGESAPPEDFSRPGEGMQAYVPAGSEKAAEAASTEETDLPFSNGCQPPERRQEVPKTLASLREQVGKGFLAARRGPFLIAGDIDKKEFSTLVDGVIACCRECLRKDYFKTPPGKIITIYVFKNETTYNENLKRLFNMLPISPYGHYGYSQRYIVVNYDTGPGTLVHEMTHSLMAPDFPQAPIWISEGMASLYEQCRVEGDSLKGESNWRLPELKQALQKGKMDSLSKLLAMSVKEFRGEGESLHYAESRYFCKFMESRNLLGKIYASFRDNVKDDPDGRKAVEQAFGETLPEIEKDWLKWLECEDWKAPAPATSLLVRPGVSCPVAFRQNPAACDAGEVAWVRSPAPMFPSRKPEKK